MYTYLWALNPRISATIKLGLFPKKENTSNESILGRLSDGNFTKPGNKAMVNKTEIK